MPKIKLKTETPITPKEARTLLRKRIQALKPLPDGWKKQFVSEHPEYDTVEWGDVLRNVYTGRSTHEQITELLEDMFGKKKVSPKKKVA